MKMIKIPLLATLFIFHSLFAAEKLGTKENPIKIYFTPSVDAHAPPSTSDFFIQFLEKETGYFFKSGITSNYIAIVEAFGSKRVDIASINSFGYLLTNAKYGAVAKLRTLRNGNSSYYGAIMVNAKSGIKSLKDLNGKRFAFTDASSTSGYLFPLKMLNDNKIKLGNTVFAGNHDSVVTMIYQGQVDAGGAFYVAPFEGKIQDARARVMTQFPDIEKKVTILKITDPIPNDPFIFRKDLPEEITQNFIKAVYKFLTTKEGRAAFKAIYALDGIIPATDKDYDSLRQVLKSTNTDAAQLVK
jgi:phosphonate transport system substrate-binding protein